MNQKDPKVSVIVPNYNYLRFLPERIESIRKQTFRDFEMILLDDCSNDGSTGYILSLRRDKDVSLVVLSDENSGSPFHQWKRGLELATGEYVWIAEADDFAEPGFLAEALKPLEEDPEVALSFVQAECVDETGAVDRGNPLYRRYIDPVGPESGPVRVYDGREYVKHNLFWRNYIYNASGVVFRRNMLSPDDIEKVESLRNDGDWLLWTMLALRGKVAVSPRRLNRFRFHDNNVTAAGEARKAHLPQMMQVTKYVLDNVDVGPVRRALMLGGYYKKWKRGDAGDHSAEVERLLEEAFPDAPRLYRYERLLKPLSSILPILTPERDRI